MKKHGKIKLAMGLGITATLIPYMVIWNVYGSILMGETYDCFEGLVGLDFESSSSRIKLPDESKLFST